MPFNIKKFLADYSEQHREPFNEALFIRSEDDIIESIKSVILSIATQSRDGRLTISVNYFNVIRDYRKVKAILYELESEEKRRNKRIDYNIHDYINLKDSDVILLEVNYHLSVNGSTLDASVYIDIPKVINKYYFKIAGTIYSTLYQIADASTYNNAQNKNRDRHISFRQIFQKHNVYEKHIKLPVYMLQEGEMQCYTGEFINYTTDLFGNNIPLIKYMLAEYGYMETMRYLCLPDIHMTVDQPYIGTESEYCFFNKDIIWLSVPKYFLDNCPVVQAFIYTVMMNLPKKNANLDTIFTKEYWLTMLGADFKNKSVEKGQNMLDSVTRNYDVSLRDEIRVPDDNKGNLLDILRWMMYEFDNLWNKDNYDMTYKKLRLSSYIAGFYAAKLSYNIMSVTNSINSLTVDKLFKTLNIQHDFILDNLKRSNLVSYKNSVNDDDIFSVLKYTFKGVSGIGENKASAVPVKYRLANPSHIGKVDCDTSPAGDPGMTGLICPYADIYHGNYLADFREPCSWKETQMSIIDEYRRLTSMKSVFVFKDELLGTQSGKELLEPLEDIIRRLSSIVVSTDIHYD